MTFTSSWLTEHWHIRHSCQALLGVYLSPEFVNLYFPYSSQGLLFFYAGGSSILNSNQHVWQWKEEAVLCETHLRNFKPQFWWDFLAYCTRAVSVHLAMVCVGGSFHVFSVFSLSFKTTTKFHEYYVFLYPFSNMAITSKKMFFLYFILINCMGWQVCIRNQLSWKQRQKVSKQTGV